VNAPAAVLTYPSGTSCRCRSRRAWRRTAPRSCRTARRRPLYCVQLVLGRCPKQLPQQRRLHREVIRQRVAPLHHAAKRVDRPALVTLLLHTSVRVRDRNYGRRDSLVPRVLVSADGRVHRFRVLPHLPRLHRARVFGSGDAVGVDPLVVRVGFVPRLRSCGRSTSRCTPAQRTGRCAYNRPGTAVRSLNSQNVLGEQH
jgi:hypothetical protein